MKKNGKSSSSQWIFQIGIMKIQTKIQIVCRQKKTKSCEEQEEEEEQEKVNGCIHFKYKQLQSGFDCQVLFSFSGFRNILIII